MVRRKNFIKREELKVLSDEISIRTVYGQLFNDRFDLMKEFDKRKKHSKGIFNTVSSSYPAMLTRNDLIMDDFTRMVQLMHPGSKLVEGKRILLAMEAMLALMNPNPKGAKELPNIQSCYQILANFYMELYPGENQYYIDAVQEKAVTNPVIIRIKSMKKPTLF
uniref:Uncharacterized protein n=1 Tax=Acrobeloides nanus TaxID=290746 RepID=A0A914CEH9_9BILA